jgi:protein YibB
MTTIVTALYDIGRGQWNNQFKRTHEEYLTYFNNILSFDSKLVIYVDEKDFEYVLSARKKIDPDLNNTVINIKKFSELEAYKKFYIKCEEVMYSPSFLQKRPESHTPEMNSPEYNIINFNKVSFLEESILNNKFNSEYFMWIDAGFYHHNFPKQYCFSKYPNPEKIKLLDDGKIHFLSLSDKIKLSSYLDARVSIAGSMFAAKIEPLMVFKKLCFETIEEFLNEGVINDDQAIYSYVYRKKPQLFNFYFGNWFQNFYEFA